MAFIINFENTPPKLLERHQPTPKKHTEQKGKKYLVEIIQMSKSKCTDAEKQKELSQEDYYRLVTFTK